MHYGVWDQAPEEAGADFEALPEPCAAGELGAGFAREPGLETDVLTSAGVSILEYGFGRFEACFGGFFQVF